MTEKTDLHQRTVYRPRKSRWHQIPVRDRTRSLWRRQSDMSYANGPQSDRPGRVQLSSVLAGTPSFALCVLFSRVDPAVGGYIHSFSIKVTFIDALDMGNAGMGSEE